MCIKKIADNLARAVRDISDETSEVYSAMVIYRHFQKFYENYKQTSTLSHDTKGTARLGMKISNPPCYFE